MRIDANRFGVRIALEANYRTASLLPRATCEWRQFAVRLWLSWRWRLHDRSPTARFRRGRPMMSNLIGFARVAAAVLVFAIGGLPCAHAAEWADIANLKINETNFLSATIVAAKAPLPEYCRVLGYVRPAINFEIRLPTKDWNGKFLMAGCGGFWGALESDNITFTNGRHVGFIRHS